MIAITSGLTPGNNGYRVVQIFPDEMPGAILSRPVASLEEAKAKAEKLVTHSGKFEWHPPTQAESQLFDQLVWVLHVAPASRIEE